MTTLEMDSLSNIFLDPMMISSEDKLDLLTTTIEESEIFSEQHEVKFMQVMIYKIILTISTILSNV